MSPFLKRTLGIVLAALITLTAAVIEGHHMRRWGVGADLAAAARSMDDLPKSLGSWELVALGEPLSDAVITELGVEGYANRVYKHRGTGQTMTLLLMAGKPGPLVRHPPNICYANQNNRQIGATELLSVGQPPASEFRVLHFEQESSLVRERFMVAYSHTVDGVWKVPDVPRLVFGGEPLLYKAQVLSSQGRDSGPEHRTALANFLEQFVSAFAGQLHMDVE